MFDRKNYMDVDYVCVQDEDDGVDLMNDDDAIEEYIERKRVEFYKEWALYLDEEYQ